MENELIQQAVALLGQCPTVVLATLDEAGTPCPVVMAKLHAEGLNVWMATDLSSHKVRHIEANPRAGLCFYAGGDSVTLRGMAEVIDDAESKHTLWQEWMIRHFPEGADDADYVLVKFIARWGIFYLNGRLESCEL